MAGLAPSWIVRKDVASAARLSPCPVPLEIIRRQLPKILASPVFASSPQMSDFLRYIVTRALEGKAGEISQESIAAHVLRRQDYNATIDSSVRVQAARLRAKLREYYECEGANDAVAIGLPKQQYIPSFTRAEGSRHAVSDRAFRLYAEGRRHWAKRMPDQLECARRCFQDALAAEPHYAAASAALAECYGFMALRGFPARDLMPKARELALAAIADDKTSAAAFAIVGFVESAFDWAWDSAERTFRHAIQLDPRCVSTRCWYARHLVATGRTSEALLQAREAQEIEPTSVLVNTFAAKILYILGRHDTAIKLLTSMCEEAPSFYLAHWGLGLCLLETKSPQAALNALAAAAQLSGNHPSMLASLGRAEARRGNLPAAQALLGQLAQLSRKVYVPGTDLAVIHAGMGDLNKAFACLETAYEQRAVDLSWLAIWPEFDRLRSDPRYGDLLARMHTARRPGADQPAA